MNLTGLRLRFYTLLKQVVEQEDHPGPPLLEPSSVPEAAPIATSR